MMNGNRSEGGADVRPIAGLSESTDEGVAAWLDDFGCGHPVRFHAGGTQGTPDAEQIIPNSSDS